MGLLRNILIPVLTDIFLYSDISIDIAHFFYYILLHVGLGVLPTLGAGLRTFQLQIWLPSVPAVALYL